MEFIDLKSQYLRGKTLIDQAIHKVLQHGQFIKGPEINELESCLAKYVGVKHCITMSSGTTALQIALMALGVGPGDEVITTPFSFFATAEVIYLLGATPVYVDITPQNYLLNPAQLEAAITSKTKAILPVNLYGQCADFDAITQIAKKYNIPTVEDGAQSFGAFYKGRASCSLSTISCTSFFPSKPLGGYGDSGACFTDNDELAHMMRVLIDHGQSTRYQHVAIGINGRCDTIQAAILLAKLSYFDEELALRQKVAGYYEKALGRDIQTPYIEPHNTSVYAQYTIEAENRDVLQAALKKQNIPTAIHYPKGLHQQPVVLKRPEAQQDFPMTESAAERVLSLPFHPYLSEETVQIIAEQVLENWHAREKI